MKNIILLFIQFLKFGCFTFGGGWSIIAQMQKVYVEEQRCITEEELLDLTSVGRSMPGVMIGNIAMLFGYRQAGILGGIACVLGLALPPMAILTVVTLFYTAFRNNQWVAAAMNGIRIAVVPIILSAAFPLMKTALKKKSGIVIAMGAFLAYLLLDIGSVGLVICGAIIGILMNVKKERKGNI